MKKTICSLHKREELFRKANRHSRYVSILKILLPILSSFIFSFFFVFVFFSSSDNINLLSINFHPEKYKNPTMIIPRIEGYIGKNKFYVLTASIATQHFQKKEIIKLKDINAIFPFGKSGKIILKAREGIFNHTNSTLNLLKPFTIITSNCTVSNFLSAEIKFQKNQFITDQKVEIITKKEHLTANGMRMFNGDYIVIFEGNVNLIINNS